MPSAASALRRALLAWGLGHIHVGDRRGWLLLVLHAVSLAALLLLSSALIEGSRWIVIFPALLLFIVAWVAQAIHAHQRAIHLGSAPGGELRIAWLLPMVVAVLTAFWLLGGEHASPSAALQQYVVAWRSERPAAAAELFRVPPSTDQLAASWQRHEEHLSNRVGEAAATFGAFSGLDPERPFDSLRFVELTAERTPDQAAFAIEITRRQRIETLLFSVLPTATQQTVVVERVGIVRVRAHDAPAPSWLPSRDVLPSRLWLVEDVELPLGEPLGSRPGVGFSTL